MEKVEEKWTWAEITCLDLDLVTTGIEPSTPPTLLPESSLLHKEDTEDFKIK
jgi:hypothetical protein